MDHEQDFNTTSWVDEKSIWSAEPQASHYVFMSFFMLLHRR